MTAVNTHNKATDQSNTPSAAASPQPMMMLARARGSVRGRMALSQMAKRGGDASVDMGKFIAESSGIR